MDKSILTLENLLLDNEVLDQLILFHKFNGEIVGGSHKMTQELGYEHEELQQIYLANIKPKSLRISDVCRTKKEDDAPVIFERRNGQRFPAFVETSVVQVLIDGELTNLSRLELSIFSDLRTYDRPVQKVNNEELEKHLGLLSNEIKKPIDGISDLISQLFESGTTENQKSLLLEMSDRLEDIDNTSNEIVDTFKLSTNSIKINPSPFNIFDLIEQVSINNHRDLQQLGASLNFYVNPLTPELLFGDSKRLEQLLISLLSFVSGSQPVGEVNLSVSPSDSVEGSSNENDKKLTISLDYIAPKDTLMATKELITAMTRNAGNADFCVHSSNVKILSQLLDVSGFFKVLDNGRAFFELSMELPEVHDLHLTHNRYFLKGKSITLISDPSRNSAIRRQLISWGASVEEIWTIEEIKENKASDLVIVLANEMYSTELYNLILAELALKHSIAIKSESDTRSYDTASQLFPEIYNVGNLGNLIATMIDEAIPYPYVLSHEQRKIVNTPSTFNVLTVGNGIRNIQPILETLSKRDCQIDFACNGIDSVIACAKQKYDLIVIEMEMERMDGAETVAHIKKSCEFNASVQVIAILKNQSGGLAISMQQAGIEHHITQPINQEQFARLIDQSLYSPIAHPKAITKDYSTSDAQHIISEVKEPDLKANDCINLNTLESLFEDTGEDVFRELINMYTREMKETHHDLSLLISQGEFDVCKKVVSAATSAALNFGSQKLYEELLKLKVLLNEFISDINNFDQHKFFNVPLATIKIVIDDTERKLIDIKKNIGLN